MDLRDWLLVIGVVIIAGILIDGYRRMRLAKKDSLQMSRDMGGNFETSPLDEDFNPELPGGGARIVHAGTSEQENTVTDSQREHIEPRFTDDNSFEQPDSDMNKASFSLENDQLFENTRDEPLKADANSRIKVEVAHAGKTAAHTGKTTDKKAAKKKQNPAPEKAPKAGIEPLVVVINVHSKEGSFPGVEIKKILEACGLDHGDMSIFHRHEEDDLLSPIQFSVANAVEPGYFDPDTLEEIATPGVSFFMSLPGPKDYMKAFDYMLETAQCFARNLNGDLKDEHRSILTSQTIEHCRQQIREFERKQLSKSRV